MKRFLWALLLATVTFSCSDDGRDTDLEISVPVSVEQVKRGTIQEFVSTSATVQAIRSATLTSEIEGRYRRANNPATGKPFAPGDIIKQGQVIIYLDNPEHENNIRIESVRLNLDISRREWEKQQSLYDKGGVTLRELKNAESTFIDAKYNFDNANIQLAKLRISAPFAGTIVNLPYYTSGVKVAVNQVMVELMDYGRLHGEVQFPANELARIKVGQKILVTHYNAPEDTLRGAFTAVNPALDATTRSFKAAIEVDNTGLILRPGMFVKVDAVVAEKSGTIVIPKEVILARRRGNTVFVVDKGAAFERVITTGLENETMVEVLDGVSLNDRLVVKGYETLRNRSKVKVVN